MGKLYICGTPIGNLEDVSIRLLKTLRMVDLIACEDTRHTIKLLNRYKIKKKMISYHEHSSSKREEYVIGLLLEGKNIALVSDAGMPGICDPGETLVQRVIESGLDVEVIPGPSAAVSALIISGLDASSFIFEGFLPRQTGKRIDTLKRNQEETRTVIYYETPHRLMKTLQDIKMVLGEKRKVVVVRELTKKHQEIKRGTIVEILDQFEQQVPRGEFCLLIEGKTSEPVSFDADQLITELDDLIKGGMDKKEAFKLKARQYSLQKSFVYKCYTDHNKGLN